MYKHERERFSSVKGECFEIPASANIYGHISRWRQFGRWRGTREPPKRVEYVWWIRGRRCWMVFVEQRINKEKQGRRGDAGSARQDASNAPDALGVIVTKNKPLL